MLTDLILAYVLLSSAVAYLLLIWFNTNAFIEYMDVLDFVGIAKIEEYVTVSKDDPSTSYPTYMLTNYPGFFTKLFGCPKCLCVYVSALVNVPVFMLATFFFSLFIWLLLPLSILVTSYFGLTAYYLLVKLIK